METITTCPVCSSHLFKSFLNCTDYLVSNQTFTIQECQHCSFRLTNPRPDAATIGAYYKSEQYISHNDAGKGIINTAYRLIRNYTLQSKLSTIYSLNKESGSVLDVGCGTGAFLQTCQKVGWQVMGTEPNDSARAVSTRKLSTEIKQDLTNLTANTTYDIITLWHVLEHIPNLNKAIEQLFGLLSEQGHLLVAVPNCNSYDAHYFQHYWAAYDVPRHLHHFTPSTIGSLFSKLGFKLVEQRAMLFDAFYIAMLSTKYQSGKVDYLKSVRIGLASNRKAKRTGDSSSLLYIFRKA